MKAKELKVKPITELKTLLSEKRDVLRNIRFKVAQRQLKKVHDLKAVKKDIARILTIIKQKSYEK